MTLCLKDAALNFHMYHADEVADLASYAALFRDTFAPPEGVDAVRQELDGLRLSASHAPGAVDAHIARFKPLRL